MPALGAGAETGMSVFFTASKVLWFLAAPSNLLVILAVLGVLACALRLRRLGWALLLVAVAGLLVLGFVPVGNAMLAPLERRFAFVDDGRPVTGVIILGGAELTERAVPFAGLARTYPEARLAFSGGDSSLFPRGPSTDGPLLRHLLKQVGIPPERVEFEEASRNTAENAAFAKEMLKPKPGERWLLVTSAYHMPRAMGTFRKAGFAVEPYPVDFRTFNGIAFELLSRAGYGLNVTDTAVKEWIGLIAYYLSGKTDALLPAPLPADQSSRGGPSR